MTPPSATSAAARPSATSDGARAPWLSTPVGAALKAIGIALALGGMTFLRWRATIDGGDALAIGLVFGLALVVVVVMAGQRPSVPPVRSVVTGIAGGAVLVALAVVASSGGPPGLVAPAAPFGPWAAITVLVAIGEEAVLRGALLDATEEAAGLVVAIVVSSVLFAIIHVPLYGWHVVPLDLAVGIWLAGLRLVSGRVAAPAIAHALADLATWWL
jgi:membrane protease YdiL (CAAX protease family)